MDEFAKPEFLAHLAANFAAHQVAVQVCHVAFPVRRVEPEQLLGNHQGQNPVAEKFQALVIVMAVVGAAVGQRVAQQQLVLELIAKAQCDLVIQRLRKSDQNPARLEKVQETAPANFERPLPNFPKGCAA